MADKTKTTDPTDPIDEEATETIAEVQKAVDPIDELTQKIHSHALDENSSEIIGALIFEKVFESDTDVLNPWQLYTKPKKKTFDAKYVRYEKTWNGLVTNLKFMDSELLRKWYPIEAIKKLEQEIRQQAADNDPPIEVVTTLDWTEKRISEALKKGKGKKHIAIQIKTWLDLKQLIDKDKKKLPSSISPIERIQKKIAGLQKIVGDDFLWKRLTNSKTYDGMAHKEITALVEQLRDAASRLDALAKGMENAVALKKQLSGKP